MLQGEDVSNAAMNGITDSCLSFIGNGENGIEPIGEGQMQQHFGSIASSEHLVDGCESRRAMLRPKMRRKYASRRTFPPEKLACAAG